MPTPFQSQNSRCDICLEPEILYTILKDPILLHNRPKSWFNQQGNVFMDTLYVLSNPIYMTLSSISNRERKALLWQVAWYPNVLFERGIRLPQNFEAFRVILQSSDTHKAPHT